MIGFDERVSGHAISKEDIFKDLGVENAEDSESVVKRNRGDDGGGIAKKPSLREIMLKRGKKDSWSSVL